MNGILRPLRDFFVSLRLTVALLILGIILIFWATLAQTDLGVWGVQQKFFHSLFVFVAIPGTQLWFPAFPGGYLIGGFLLVNLVCAHIYRLKLTPRKAGIWITHLGLILLLVGELMSGLLQKDYDLRSTTARPRTTRKASATTSWRSSTRPIRSSTRWSRSPRR